MQVLLGEVLAALTGFDVIAGPVADDVPDLVAGNGRDHRTDRQRPHVARAGFVAGENDSGCDQKRITGEKQPEDDRALDEDERDDDDPDQQRPGSLERGETAGCERHRRQFFASFCNQGVGSSGTVTVELSVVEVFAVSPRLDARIRFPISKTIGRTDTRTIKMKM